MYCLYYILVWDTAPIRIELEIVQAAAVAGCNTSRGPPPKVDIAVGINMVAPQLPPPP